MPGSFGTILKQGDGVADLLLSGYKTFPAMFRAAISDKGTGWLGASGGGEMVLTLHPH